MELVTRTHDRSTSRVEKGDLRADLLVAVLLVCAALALYLYQLGTVPANLTADEVDNLSDIVKIRAGVGPGLFGLDWKPNPAYSLYLMAYAMNLFGVSVAGFRATSAALGALTLAPTYLLAREQVGRLAAALAAILLGTTVWFLNFSRSGWENVHIAFYGTMAALTLSVALRRDRLPLYILPGIFAGLAVNGYFSGKLVPVGLIAYLPFALLLNRDRWRRVLLGYGIWLAVCLALFAPQVPEIVNNWAYYTRRSAGVSVFHAKLPYEGADSLPALLVHQVVRTARGFLLMDGSVVGLPRYSPLRQPIFGLVTAALYVLGLALGAIHWRRTALWACMMGTALVGTQVFTLNTPDLARGIGAAPFMVLFASLPLSIVTQRRWRWQNALRVAACTVVLAAAVSGVATYFTWIQQPATLDARTPAIADSAFQSFVSAKHAELAARRLGETTQVQ